MYYEVLISSRGQDQSQVKWHTMQTKINPQSMLIIRIICTLSDHLPKSLHNSSMMVVMVIMVTMAMITIMVEVVMIIITALHYTLQCFHVLIFWLLSDNKTVYQYER